MSCLLWRTCVAWVSWGNCTSNIRISLENFISMEIAWNLWQWGNFYSALYWFREISLNSGRVAIYNLRILVDSILKLSSNIWVYWTSADWDWNIWSISEDSKCWGSWSQETMRSARRNALAIIYCPPLWFEPTSPGAQPKRPIHIIETK